MSNTLTLCVFIDAFGWEIASRHPQFMANALPVRSPLGTVFGYSCTCDPTILTGKMPREHGHFSFFRYAPEESPFHVPEIDILSLLPQAVTSRGRVRHWISRVLGKRFGYTGYFQIYNVPFKYLSLFDYTEKKDLYQSQGINSGCMTIFDRLRAARIPFYCSDWRVSETENLASLMQAMESPEEKPRFAYLYLAAMDAILHADGTRSQRVTDKIAWYDQELTKVITAAQQRYDDVRVLVFSDHGMTDVQTTCDLQSRIATTGLKFGVDYAAMYDSTMARFWFLTPGAKERITAALEEEPKGTILSDETLTEWGCDFPDKRYGELFFALRPGNLLCPSFMGETPLRGMHGFDPNHADSVAFFATNAAEYSGTYAPRRLDDLYTLMCQEAGLMNRDVLTRKAA